MISFMLKYKKGIAVFLAVCVLATLIPILTDISSRTATLAADENEQKIAADISTSTGVEVEKILSLRKGGKSWNEILEYLKGKGGSAEDREEMDMILTAEALGEEDVELLLNAGFTREEIQQATLIAERVQFQLQEIASSNGTEEISYVQKVPDTSGISVEKNDIADYKELEEKFSLKTVIRLMLELIDSFGSMEQVMDEYLYSLQADIILEDYIVDIEAYLEEKNNKSLVAEHKKFITMSDIENEMLKAIQQHNVNNVINEVPDSSMNPLDNMKLQNEEGPSSPLPKLEDVTPRNPGEDILDEIQQINPLGK